MCVAQMLCFEAKSETLQKSAIICDNRCWREEKKLALISEIKFSTNFVRLGCPGAKTFPKDSVSKRAFRETARNCKNVSHTSSVYKHRICLQEIFKFARGSASKIQSSSPTNIRNESSEASTSNIEA